jgi:hypothetical protein
MALTTYALSSDVNVDALLESENTKPSNIHSQWLALNKWRISGLRPPLITKMQKSTIDFVNRIGT